ncbi:MAG: hypothetical protein AAGG11_12915 [Pseudomonadota bacterium]
MLLFRQLLSLLVLVGWAALACAGQDSDNSAAGGLNVSQDLRHRVVVPQIIYFRIGTASPGAVDEVRFDLGPSVGNNQSYSGAAPPVGNGIPVAASGGALEVEIRSNVGTVNLSYDLSSPLGLANGVGNYVPFDDILVTSADPAGLPAPALSNSGGGGVSSVPVSGNFFAGRVIRRQTQWAFSYANRTPLRAGTYNGRIRYTIAVP